MTTTSKRNPLLRFLGWIWSGIDGVRKVLHLILLLFLFMLIFGLNADVPSIVPTSSALHVQPYGVLVEELSGDPYDRAIAEFLDDGLPQTRVGDIVAALRHAKTDDRIAVVYLDLSALGGGGLSKLQVVAAAIADFKTSGKPVIAAADFMGQQGYYLAAHADEIYLHPDGAVLFRGYGQYRQFYKEAIDFLRIDWNVFRVGTHKSFIEPYTRSDMSPEDRESTSRLVEQLWALYSNGVESARGLEPGTLDEFAQNFLTRVGAANGDVAIAARDVGLIDALLTRNEVNSKMIELVGTSAQEPARFNATDMHDYLAQMEMMAGSDVADDNVAVIVAAGDIMFGEQSPGNIGGDSTAALLRKARLAPAVSAVVLRIDSPGGSAFAAELIADEIEALKAAGKPIVASLSSVAASGGYTIAMHADQVLASPATITGSIGVFGMFPTYQRSFEALGVYSDGVGTTPLSGQLQPDRALTPETRQLLQLLVEDTYDDFISDVALYRGMEKAAVDAIGQGQVWTGAEAVANGLVDELGTLQAAIAAAAELAGLEQGEYGTFYLEQELSASEQMIVDLLGVSLSVGLDMSAWVSTPDLIKQFAADVDRKMARLMRFNDPQGIYTHCLCDLN